MFFIFISALFLMINRSPCNIRHPEYTELFSRLMERSTLLPQDLDFEHVILENALENVVRKYRRHLQIIKPALEMLLQQVEQVGNKK